MLLWCQSGTGTGLPPSTSVSPVSIIPPMLHSPLSVSFHQRSTLPCQYHSTNAPHSTSTTRCSYQDKRSNVGNFPESDPDSIRFRSTLTFPYLPNRRAVGTRLDSNDLHSPSSGHVILPPHFPRALLWSPTRIH